MTDVKVGLGIVDDGSITAYLAQLKKLDEQLANVAKNNGEMDASLSKNVSGMLKQASEIRKTLQAYARDKFSLITNPTKKDRLEHEAFIKHIGSLQGAMVEDYNKKVQAMLKQERDQLVKNAKAKRAIDIAATRRERNEALELINSKKAASKLNKEQATQLIGQARYQTREDTARGSPQAEAGRKRIALLEERLRVLAKPGIADRENSINKLASDPKALKTFMAKATPEVIREYVKTANKMSRTSFDAGDPAAGANLGQLAGQFKNALAQMSPVFKEVQKLTTEILKPNNKLLKNVSRENLQQTQSQAAIIRRELNKATAAGDSDNASKYERALEKLTSQIDIVKNGPRLSRIRELSSLSTAGTNLDDEFAKFATGKTQAQLKGLSGAAKNKYNTLSDNKDDKAAEGWRLVVSKLDKQIALMKEAENPKTVKEQTIKRQQGDIDAERIREYAATRYDGQALNKSPSTVAGMGIADTQGLVRQGKQRLEAQQFRVDSATGTQKAEEQAVLALLKSQLAQLERQLKVKQDIAKTANDKNNPEYQAEQARKANERLALQTSESTMRQKAQQGLNQRRVNREVDGGAEMFRNQMLLLRNYAVMGAGVGGAYSAGNFIVGLDKSFKQLQSILALTNNDMDKLKGNLISVSELTKFDALEVVDTSIILGQAGLNKDQIVKSIEGITLFATAIGTDLKSAVDLATSTLGVYNIEASRMPEIVDKLTLSINRSKLNLDKLSLGIQYAGNIAEQSNVSFEDTVAALAAMANSGIKSGSTLGTGLRQILITLQKPSDAFKKKMVELGIGMEDLDLKSHSLTDVMQTLSQSGFTVVDAMKTMEVRAAAAFGAFANNIDTARDITKQMQEGGAASAANVVQMEALANQWARFSSVVKSIFYDALAPVVEILAKALTVTTDWLSSLRATGDTIQYIVSGLVTLVGLKTAISTLNLGGRLIGGAAKGGFFGKMYGLARGGATAAAATTATTAAATTAATSAGAIMPVVMTVIRAIIGGPVVWGLAAAGAVAAGVYAKNQRADRLGDALDQAKFYKGGIDARIDRNDMGIKDIGSSISSAYYRKETFEDPERGQERLVSFIGDLNAKLRSIGFYMDPTTASFDGLIAKLQETREKIEGFQTIDLAKQADAGLDIAIAEQKVLAGTKFKSPFFSKLNSQEEYVASQGAGRNTGYFQDSAQLRKQRLVLQNLAPEVSDDFLATGRESRGTFKKSPFELLLDRAKALDPKTSTQEEFDSVRAELSRIYSTLAGAKGRDSETTQKQTGFSEEEINKLLTEQINLATTALNSVDKIQAAKKPLEDLEQNEIVRNIRQQVLKEFETPIAQRIAEVSSQSIKLRDPKFAGQDSVKLYENFEAFVKSSSSELQGFADAVEAKTKELVAQQPTLDAKTVLPLIINSFPKLSSIGNTQGQLTSDLGELGPNAAKALRSRTRSAERANRSELEEQRLLRKDTNTEDGILGIGNRIEILMKEQYDREVKLINMEAQDEETRRQRLESLNEQYIAELGINAQETQRALSEFFTTEDLKKGGVLDSTLTSKSDERAVLSILNNDFKKALSGDKAVNAEANVKAQEAREKARRLRAESDDAKFRSTNKNFSPEDRAGYKAKFDQLSPQAEQAEVEAKNLELESVVAEGTSKAALKENLEGLLVQEMSPVVRAAITGQLEQLDIILAELIARVVKLGGDSSLIQVKSQNEREINQAKYDYVGTNSGKSQEDKLARKEARRLEIEFRTKQAELAEAFKQRQEAAEKQLNKAEELKAIAADAKEIASDQGLPDMQRRQAQYQELMAVQAAAEAMAKYLEMKADNLATDTQAKSELLTEYTTKANTPNQNEIITTQFQQEINRLKPEIAENGKQLEKVAGDLSKNSQETIKQTQEIRGNSEALRYAGKRYLTEERRKMKATIEGGEYQTDLQVDRGKGEMTSAGTPAGGFGTQITNGLRDVFQSSMDSYEGIDMLTEGMLGLKDITSGMGDEFAGFFSEFAKGSMSAGDAFRGFGASVMSSMTDMATKYLANMAMQQIMSFAMSFLSPTPGPNAGGPAMPANVQTAWTGGLVGAPRRYASGGLVTGGMRTRDSTLINAAQGEFVLRQAAVDAIGLEGVNALNNLDKNTVNSLESVKPSDSPERPEGDKTVNIWVVSEEEAKQGMDDNSILVVVDKALMRNSNTKKLVKRISTGDM